MKLLKVYFLLILLIRIIYYIGKISDDKYYNFSKDFTLEYYSALFKNEWNLRDETLKYLNNDLLSLSQVLDKMSNFIYDHFRLNITKSISPGGKAPWGKLPPGLRPGAISNILSNLDQNKLDLYYS